MKQIQGIHPALLHSPFTVNDVILKRTCFNKVGFITNVDLKQSNPKT